jgi:predicted Zn-dependent protease
MSTAMAANAGIIAAGLFSDKPGQTMALAAAAATVAIKLPNSRTSENEADQIGIELAAKAGYDPRAAVTLWQKMAKVGGGSPPEFMSTHPSDETRQQRLGALAPKMMPYYQAQVARPTYPVRMGPAGV